jgi:hypothetical protein
MNTFKHIAALCLLGLLFTTTLTFANDNDNAPKANTASATGWVPSTSKSFMVRTMQGKNGDLLVWVYNGVKQPVTARILDMKGNELAYNPLGSRPKTYGMRFDMSEMGDGNYRLEVRAGEERVVKSVRVFTPESPGRQAAITVGE